MRCIDEIPAEKLRGKRVLVRAGLDLPLGSDGEVTDTFRVKKAIPTLEYLSRQGARTIILSHIGRDPEQTNAPVARALSRYVKVFYVPDLFGPAAHSAVAALKDGEIVLLENIRKDSRERDNDDSLAHDLAPLGEIYINDAFSNSHRDYPSMTGLPKLMPSYAGFLLRDEVAALDAARTPAQPSFAILGGAKFETKAPLIRELLKRYDHLFITGALANDVFKARNLPVGRSLISAELPDASVLNDPHFLAPIDVTVEREDGQARVKTPEATEAGDKIVDIGPDSVREIAPFIEQAKFILWNGPTGLYEGGYTEWTHTIAELIAKSSANKVIGGGDTIAAIQESGISDEKLGFLSTGGGAMLEYLLKGTLPGIAVLG
jgi:phosphoglycerate kinase